MSKVLIIIPAFNEEDNLANVLTELRSSVNHDILVVDDASTDNTEMITKQLNCRVLKLSSNLGAWKATQTGIRYALKNGYSEVVTFDADGQHNAKEVNHLLDSLNDNTDVVVGARRVRVGKSKTFIWALLRSVSGLSIHDLTSGFRAYGHKALEVLSTPAASMLDYQDVGVLALLKANGCQISEVEVKMADRMSGRSKIFGSLISIIRYLIYSVIIGMAKK